MRRGAVDLIRARIDRDYALEMIHQSKRGLPVARSAVERNPMLWRQSGQEREQRIGIERAKGGVERRAIGEKILEVQNRLRWRRAGDSTPDSDCD